MHKESITGCQINNPSSPKLWRAHVDACRKSGLSRAEYCRQHNISHHALRYWHKKHVKPGSSAVTFVPVPLTRALQFKSPQEKKSSLKVEIGNRFKVEVADDFLSTTLARVIATLEGI